MEKIKVIVVDDSAVVRQVIREVLKTAPDIDVIAVASDPIFALEKMKNVWPDVLVLDIEMPRMDGLTFLRKIMAERPTPVIICSSLTEKGGQTTLDALSAGGVEVLTKPKIGVKNFLEESAQALVLAVRAAARVNMKRLQAMAVKPPPKLTADVILEAKLASQTAMAKTTDRVVAIGTSTGGTQALEAVLSQLTPSCPGLIIVQHMPEKFTALFATRLNKVCAIEVVEARKGDRVMPGRALIAPGDRHMLLKRSGAQYLVDIVDGPRVNRHKPSVNVLFRSVAQIAGSNALGIIMTGMGDDGASGLKEMRECGASTIAEDESSCVVFGMPKEAIKLGAAEKVLPLAVIHREIEAFK